jgi:PAS domain S-box-containing protein
MHGVIADIDARQRAVSALLERERELRSLADNVPDMLARFDRGLRVVFANAAAARGADRPAADLLGRAVRELDLEVELAERWEAALRKVFATAGTARLEYEARTSKGPRHYEVRMVPELGPAGAVDSVLAIARDVTKRVAAEASLREAARSLEQAKQAAQAAAADLEQRVRQRTEELDGAREAAEAASTAKSEFLAHMSHELRTPLTGMIAAADLLLAEPLADAQAGRVAVMRRSTLALKGLLDDVLDFARIEAGKVESTPVRFSPAAVVDDVCDLFADAAREHGSRLRRRLATDLRGPAWAMRRTCGRSC